jgi:putative phosphoribosyl transferase
MPNTAYHFADRKQAGKMLAEALSDYARKPDVLVLALPRGGVPVAYEIAEAVAAPLDLWLVRKLGAPRREELAMGAIAGGGVRVLDRDIIRLLDVDQASLDTVMAREQAELERRNNHYRQGRPPADVQGKTVILVDDGLATGATIRAAIVSLRSAGAERIIVAVPVGAASASEKIQEEADEFVCLYTPEPFYGVGKWYDDFSQTTDEEVLALLSSTAVIDGAKGLQRGGLRNRNS